MNDRLKLTPLFFRDLNDDLQNEFKREMQNNNRTDLLKAIEDGADVQVGIFHLIQDFEVVE